MVPLESSRIPRTPTDREIPSTPIPGALSTPRTPEVSHWSQPTVSPKGSPFPETPFTPAEPPYTLPVTNFPPKMFPEFAFAHPNTPEAPLVELVLRPYTAAFAPGPPVSATTPNPVPLLP